MKAKKKTPHAKLNFRYPVVTQGSKEARTLRQECNSLSPAERAKLFQQGMKIINGQ